MDADVEGLNDAGRYERDDGYKAERNGSRFEIAQLQQDHGKWATLVLIDLAVRRDVGKVEGGDILDSIGSSAATHSLRVPSSAIFGLV